MGFGWKSQFCDIFALCALVSACCGQALAQQNAQWAAFAQDGYKPSQMQSIGSQICSMGAASSSLGGLTAPAGSPVSSSSSENNIQQMGSDSSSIVVELKRQLLIDYAVGFAKVFNQHEYQEELQQNADQGIHAQTPQCDPGDSACDGIANDIRRIATGSANNDYDWCGMFVSTLTDMVDHQAHGGPTNLLRDSRTTTNSEDYASAVKLLAVFDPDVSLEKYRSLFCSMPFGCNVPPKRTDAFLQPGQTPIPGCMAVYLSADGKQGHMGLVISVDKTGTAGAGTMDTVEGNSMPVSGSAARGIFLHTGRAWGSGVAIDSNDGPGNQKLYYRGCVMPWPGMLQAQSQSEETGCSAAVSDSSLKPAIPVYATTAPSVPKIPSAAASGSASDSSLGSAAGTLENLLNDWF